MAHPDRILAADFPQAVEQRAGLFDLDVGAAELRRVTALDFAAELHGHRLLAVADGEDRHAQVERSFWRAGGILRCDAGGPAGEDHRFRIEACRQNRVGAVVGVDLAVDAHFPKAARDKLRHLTAEIDNQDALVLGRLRCVTRHGVR